MLECRLYSTLGCHLCELAEQQLLPLLSEMALQIEWVDIAENPDWMDRYALQIPVLQRLDNQQELLWPFDTEQARAFCMA